ncbi:MAG: sigma-70 family RNA polymerase sigma factor [Gemmatimonadetes bacterium]|nr:hypothetical protein [Gemmatimonadota bacterium]MXY49884.1 sigma-70 family RNA polymerase sigma factor [Gemmatimonadota bacterium]MYG85099.1 sigma-70 family RNA polymerase sigma factor [Gemmatimonadota bacterium]MYJ89323.1 sigma-70 family RNA polymerase sigma factor [Gemmatimonadota bacterium]
MYNPEFWEIRLDQVDLEQYPNEANIWYETGEDRVHRYQREDRVDELADAVYDFLSQYLTQKQCEVVVLYFIYQKTQQETAEILGISRRVVSQHLFGICRGGKHIGGAVNKLRKLCARHGIDFQPAERKFETHEYSEQLAMSA